MIFEISFGLRLKSGERIEFSEEGRDAAPEINLQVFYVHNFLTYDATNDFGKKLISFPLN